MELGLDNSAYASANSLGVVAAVAYVAIFPSLVAYIFYNRGVELLGPTRAGVYLFLVPIFGAVLATFFLGETLHLFHAVAFGLIVAGVLLAGRRRGSSEPVADQV